MVIPALGPNIAFSGSNSKSNLKAEKSVVNTNLLSEEVKNVKKPSSFLRNMRNGIIAMGFAGSVLTGCGKPDITPDPNPGKQPKDTTIVKPPKDTAVVKPPKDTTVVNPPKDTIIVVPPKDSTIIKPPVTTKTKVISMLDALGLIPHTKSTGTTAVLPKEVDYYEPFTGTDIKDEFLSTSTDDTIRIKENHSGGGQDLGNYNLKVYAKGDTIVSESSDAVTNKFRETNKFFFQDGGVTKTFSKTPGRVHKFFPKDQVSLTVKALKDGIQVGTDKILKLLKVVF